MNSDSSRVGGIIALAGAGLGAIGCLGPWATLGIFSQNGMNADGQIVLPILAVSVVLTAIWFSNNNNTLLGSAAAAAAIAGLIGINDMVDVSTSTTEVFDNQIGASVGWGLWLVVVGSAAALFGAIFQIVTGPDPEPKVGKGQVLVGTLRALDPPADLTEGWKSDPLQEGRLRWWNGTEWEPKVGVRPESPPPAP